MNWEMIGVIIVIIGIQGGLLVAAAKSIFVTKEDHEIDMKDIDDKLYDNKSMTVFVPREEWEKSKHGRERRRDGNQQAVCDKIEKMRVDMDIIKISQNETNIAISNLLGRFEQYIKIKIGKEN